MNTISLPSEQDRFLASEVARTICERLDQTDLSDALFDQTANQLARDFGRLLTTKTTPDYEELFAAAVEDRLVFERQRSFR